MDRKHLALCKDRGFIVLHGELQTRAGYRSVLWSSRLDIPSTMMILMYALRPSEVTTSALNASSVQSSNASESSFQGMSR